MAIRVVILGDIVGGNGLLAVVQCVPVIRERHQPDLILANAENAANGSGLTPSLYQKLCAAGLDGMTLGDHAYKKKQIVPTLEHEPNLIRPANLSAQARGKGSMTLDVQRDGEAAVHLHVTTLLGRLYMNLPANDPFAAADHWLAQLPRVGDAPPIALVEMHAEASSEKQAMGWHLNGRVAAVFGTHTHIATADARLLPPEPGAGVSSEGTAYITDLGMCGPRDSILGRRVDRVLTHMTTNMPAPFDVADAAPAVCGVMIEIDESTGLSTHVERIELDADPEEPPFVA